ncbi:nuclear transport factor 2 family protein [Hoeflea prorocentri]|uniref:Nuclear transport factor 2 family protein n=1 Tax=Hoeflea prorocentri TaxID=1922333 RepID=A0A9X3UQM5_9HYPH|nr:nuclear transport factor 2 family protein [Hoeflea prorocentri]MCY6383584.1 nuclear transport factor 2 family protein [Hoeflea prorocentri]MDA5401384.1 nuclear transport factor 2 family protein [Hoeflea prorocentri]
MAEEEINVEILRNAYNAWHETGGDTRVWSDVFADRLDWGSSMEAMPELVFTRQRAPKQEVIKHYEELASEWSMDFFRVNEFIARGERVIALGECSFTHRQTGRKVRGPKIDLWLFKNGKATEFMEY